MNYIDWSRITEVWLGCNHPYCNINGNVGHGDTLKEAIESAKESGWALNTRKKGDNGSCFALCPKHNPKNHVTDKG